MVEREGIKASGEFGRSLLSIQPLLRVPGDGLLGCVSYWTTEGECTLN